MVYDHAEESEFREILDLIPSESVPIQELPAPEPGDEKPVDEETPEYRLLELSLDGDLGQIVGVLDREIPDGAKVEFVFDRFEYRMEPLGENRSKWLGPVPGIEAAAGTLFGWIKVTLDGEVRTSSQRWLDDIGRIRHATRDQKVVRAFRGLARRPSTPKEQDQIISDLALITSSVFGDVSNFPDPIRKRPREVNDEVTEVAAPVDPKQLIRSLDELVSRPLKPVSLAESVSEFSLSGIMRVLFGLYENAASSPEEIEAAIEPELDEDSAGPPHSNELGPASQLETESRPPPKPTPERILKKVRTLLDECSANLRKESFTDQCSARQMVNATVFFSGRFGAGGKRTLAQ